MVLLFSSYLANRLETVTVNGVTSTPVNISCGVSQGSVLAPILFLLYILKDFHHCSNFFDFHLFADDTNLFCNKKISPLYRQVLTVNFLMSIPGFVLIDFLLI